MAVASTALSRGAGRVSRRLDRLSEHKFALLVSIPGLILVALIVLPPTLAVFGMSLFRIELGKDDLTPFVGLNNYLVRLPLDDEVLAAIPRTLFFAAMSTAITLPLALVTALVLNRGFRGVSIFFMALLLPWAVASIVAGIFWRAIFDTNHGIVNGVLVGFGILDEPFNWLASTAQTVGIALVAQSWRSVPLLAVLLLAALKTIPPALYRAAKMDGATSWESFRFITLPAIKNTLIVVGVLQVIIGLQVFDLLYSLTSGGPGRDTYVLIMAIYDITFGQISLGYGAAITVILFLIIVAASFLILIARVRRRAPVAVIDDEAEEAAATGRTSLRLDSGSAMAIRASARETTRGRSAEADQTASDGDQDRLRGRCARPLLLLCRPDRVDDHRQPAAEPGPRLDAAQPDPQPVARRLPDDRRRSTLARIAGGEPAGRTADRILRHRPQRAAGLRPRPLRHHAARGRSWRC